MKFLKLTIIILVCLFTASGYAKELKFDPYTKEDIALEVVWATFHIIDWGQTLNIADNPQKYRETNPFLSDHPSKGSVNLYMVAWLVAHPLITYVLPKEVVIFDCKIPLRAAFQTVSIGLSGYATIHNFGMGVHISF